MLQQIIGQQSEQVPSGIFTLINTVRTVGVGHHGNLSTLETDGCDAVAVPLSDTFKNGLFVAMNDEKNFYFYDLGKLVLER